MRRAGSAGAGAAKAIFAILVLLIIGPAVCWVFYQTSGPATLSQPDALDTAQVARNVAEGKGFVTDIIRPLALQTVRDFDPPIAELSMGPLPLILVAVVFKVRGAVDDALATASVIPLALTVPVIYLIGARLLSRRVGVLSVIVYVLAHRIVQLSISGTRYSFSAFVVALLFLVLTYARPKGAAGSARAPRWTAVALGALLGILYMADPQSWFLLLPLAAYLLMSGGWDRRSWGHVAVMLGAALVVASPWLIRNIVVVGNPFFDLRGYELCMSNRDNTGFSLYRRFNFPVQPPFLYLLVHLMTALGRLANGARVMQSDMLIYPDVYVTAAFLFGLLVRAWDNHVRRIKWTAAIAVGFAFWFAAMRYPSLTPTSTAFYALSPVVAVFGIATLVELVGRLEVHLFYQNLILALVPALVAIPLVTTIAANVRAGRLPDVKNVPLTFKTIANEVPDDIPVYTDSPWLVAWYGKHPAIWLPQRTSDIREVTALIPMQVGCLTTLLRGYSLDEDFAYWQRLHANLQAPEGCQIVSGPEMFIREGSYIFARTGLMEPPSNPPPEVVPQQPGPEEGAQ